MEIKLKMAGGIWLAISVALTASIAGRNLGHTETGMHWMMVSTREEDRVML